MNKTDNELLFLAEKHIKLFLIMNQWTRLLQDGKSIISFFEKRKYKKIVIYGFGVVGETLERELRNTDIEIAYIVDRNAEYMYAPVRIIKPTDEFEDVDIMVVTAIDDTGKLISDLRHKCDFKIISIEEIINET